MAYCTPWSLSDVAEGPITEVAGFESGTMAPLSASNDPTSPRYTPATQLAPAPEKSQQWQTQEYSNRETFGFHCNEALPPTAYEAEREASSKRRKDTAVKRAQAPLNSDDLTPDRRRRVQAYQTGLHKCSWCDFCGIVARDKVKHEETVIKRGSNGNMSMASCDQCGKVFCLRMPVHSCLDERLSEEMRSFGHLEFVSLEADAPGTSTEGFAQRALSRSPAVEGRLYVTPEDVHNLLTKGGVQELVGYVVSAPGKGPVSRRKGPVSRSTDDILWKSRCWGTPEMSVFQAKAHAAEKEKAKSSTSSPSSTIPEPARQSDQFVFVNDDAKGMAQGYFRNTARLENVTADQVQVFVEAEAEVEANQWLSNMIMFNPDIAPTQQFGAEKTPQRESNFGVEGPVRHSGLGSFDLNDHHIPTRAGAFNSLEHVERAGLFASSHAECFCGTVSGYHTDECFHRASGSQR